MVHHILRLLNSFNDLSFEFNFLITLLNRLLLIIYYFLAINILSKLILFALLAQYLSLFSHVLYLNIIAIFSYWLWRMSHIFLKRFIMYIISIFQVKHWFLSYCMRHLTQLMQVIMRLIMNHSKIFLWWISISCCIYL